jgi:hypothetical protein
MFVSVEGSSAPYCIRRAREPGEGKLMISFDRAARDWEPAFAVAALCTKLIAAMLASVRVS